MSENFNVDLAFRVLEAVEAHPESWWQGTWRCGSGMCYAGWTAEVTSAEWLLPVPEYTNSWGGVSRESEMVRVPTEFNSLFDRHTEHVSQYAREVLGLDADQAEVLFDATNTLADLRSILLALKDDPDIDYRKLYALKEEADD